MAHADTSDSEAFESADEDFEDDDETSTSEQVSVLSNVALAVNTEQKHVTGKTDKIKSEPVVTSVKKKYSKESKTATDVKEICDTKNKLKSKQEKVSVETNLVTSEIVNSPEESENQFEHDEPPRMVACWVPGADNVAASEYVRKYNEDRRNDYEMKKKDISGDGLVQSTNFNAVKSETTEKGWEDFDNWASPDIKDNRSVSEEKTIYNKVSEYADPPERVGCWEQEVDNWAAAEHVKKYNENKGTAKQVENKTKEKYPKGDDNVKNKTDENQLINSKFSYENRDDADNWGDDFGDWEDDTKYEKTDSDWNDFNNWEPVKEPIGSKTKKDVTSILEKLSVQSDKEKKDNSWGKWDGWGVSSILSTATDSMQTFTSQVSQGITTVFESGIGAPSPEELAKIQKLEKEKKKEKIEIEQLTTNENQSSSFGFGNLLSGVTKLVETTGSKVVNTGLDTLEVIGKKTMEVLQEGDPGLAKKRAMLGLDSDKPVLSRILREAKEKNEVEDREIEKKKEIKKVHFETLFDDHQGLVHLEALEMLSKQCDIKLNGLIETYTAEELNDLQETMLQVRELCELPDEEEEEQNDISLIKDRLENAVTDLGVNISYDKLLTVWEQSESNMKNINDTMEVHEQAIETLARITAAAVEQFHKSAELLLIKERRSTADEADSLVQLTSNLTALIGVVAAKFSEKLDTFGNQSYNPELNSLITNVFFEATNSSSYIQDAFQLLIPVLQVGAI